MCRTLAGVFAVALVVATGACSGAQPARAPASPEPRSELAAELTSPIEASVERGLLPALQVQGEPVPHAVLAERMAALKIPGLAIAVFDETGIVWAKGFGLADVESKAPVTSGTLFQAGSISKSVNALAVLLAANAGRFDLDRPINELLKTWQLPANDFTRESPVTLRRLLSHTAGTTVHGFPGYPTGASLPTLLDVLDGRAPANTPPVRVDLLPGSQFRYSGGGTSITQLLLVEAFSQPYPTILKERVLGPLGLSSSSFQQPLPPEQLALAAAGHGQDGSVVPSRRHVYPEMAAAGLWTTATDLAIFFREVALARTGRSKTVAQNVALQITTEVPTADAHSGLGVFLQRRNDVGYFGHDGVDEGFHASAIASLDGAHGLTMMANSANGSSLFPEIERTVFAAMGWPGADASVARVALTEAQRAVWLGDYAAPGHIPFSVRSEADHLTLVRPFRQPEELVPVAPARALERSSGVRYSVGPAGLELETARGPLGSVPRVEADAPMPLIELAAGREDDAIRAWRAQVGPDARPTPQNLGIYLSYGHDLLRDGNTEAAIAIFGAASIVFPNLPRVHASLGAARAAAGQHAQAAQAFEAALERLEHAVWLPPSERAQLRLIFERQLTEAQAQAAAH